MCSVAPTFKNTEMLESIIDLKDSKNWLSILIKWWLNPSNGSHLINVQWIPFFFIPILLSWKEYFCGRNLLMLCAHRSSLIKLFNFFCKCSQFKLLVFLIYSFCFVNKFNFESFLKFNNYGQVKKHKNKTLIIVKI